MSDKSLYFVVDDLSPPREPYNPEVDPALKGALDLIKIEDAATDRVVDRLLNEAVEGVLKEDD